MIFMSYLETELFVVIYELFYSYVFQKRTIIPICVGDEGLFA